jgi:ADP-heptose:LPS heptosyltransferase
MADGRASADPMRQPGATREDPTMSIHLFPEPVERIAVLRALQLGGLLCAIPALRALRTAFPGAHITLVGLPSARELLGRYAYVDELVPFPGFPGLPEREPDIAALPGFLQHAQAQRYDLAVQMQGSGELANPLTIALGAKLNAGFHPLLGWCPDPARFVPWPERGSEVLRWLRLLQYLGIAARGEQLEFPLLPRDLHAYGKLARHHALQPRRYACVHPGARMPSRRWPAERFAQVGDWLAGQGCHVVITGTAEQLPLAREVAELMRAPSLVLAGSTALGTFAALLAQACLLVCNDGGASQLAAALRVPSVVISSGADVERWAPLDSDRHRVLHHPVICRPCTHYSCPFGHPCALAVDPQAVMREAAALLLRSPVTLCEPAGAAGTDRWKDCRGLQNLHV